MFNFFLNSIKGQRSQEREAHYYRELIRQEAKIGGQLFGPVPQGGRREFFCLNEHTWVWHEEWLDQKGARQAVTTRYEVRPNGVLKAQDGQPYRPVGKEEHRNLCRAAKLYNKRVRTELYA